MLKILGMQLTLRIWDLRGELRVIEQISGDLSAGVGYTLVSTSDDYHLSVNSGNMYGISAHAGASIGLSFGLTGNKDGIGFSFGVGPSWGVSATEICGVDVNGSSTDEIYNHDFK